MSRRDDTMRLRDMLDAAQAAIRVLGDRTADELENAEALALAVPPGPVAVIVYVVSSVGETSRTPLRPAESIPFMVQEVAQCVSHVSVALSPMVMVVGDTLIEAVGLTVTVTLAVALSSEPLAVIVYVVVSEG